jgi:hypothetical protein
LYSMPLKHKLDFLGLVKYLKDISLPTTLQCSTYVYLGVGISAHISYLPVSALVSTSTKPI